MINGTLIVKTNAFDRFKIPIHTSEYETIDDLLNVITSKRYFTIHDKAEGHDVVTFNSNHVVHICFKEDCDG